MFIREGVCYRRCGNVVYLRNISTRKDYLLNLMALDILDYWKEHPEDRIEDVCRWIQEHYKVKDTEAMKTDVEHFADFFAREKIFRDSEPPESQRPYLSVRGQAEEHCLQAGQLFSAGLELTYRCDARCIHCYIDDGGPGIASQELSLDEYKRILDELHMLGCIRILLTGGEVCLRKDFIAIAQYAVSLGMLVDVYTNGINMSDEQFDALCAMNINSVSFSLYSADPEAHDRITLVPGSFRRTMHRMMMFKCAGVDVFVKTVVLQQNLSSLESLYQMGKRLHIPVLPSVTVVDSHTGKSADHCRLTGREQLERALELELRYSDSPPAPRVRDPEECICMGGQTSLSINPYGGVYPCLAFRKAAGNVRETPLKEIWEHSPFLKEIRRLRFSDVEAACTSCQFLNQCPICIGDCYEPKSGKICPNPATCAAAEAICHLFAPT